MSNDKNNFDLADLGSSLPAAAAGISKPLSLKQEFWILSWFLFFVFFFP